MLTFPTAIKQEMTKQAQPYAFVLLFEVKIENEDLVYLCRNNQDIVFAGNTYLKWGIEVDSIKSDISGKINNFYIKIDNTLRVIQQLIAKYDNLSNSYVIIKVVHTNNLSVPIPDFDSKYMIKSVSFDNSIADFEIGVEDIIRKRVPYRAYNKNRCPYIYKGIECGSVSIKTDCGKTLSDCRLRSNASRFGGEINIPDLSGVYT